VTQRTDQNQLGIKLAQVILTGFLCEESVMIHTIYGSILGILFSSMVTMAVAAPTCTVAATEIEHTQAAGFRSQKQEYSAAADLSVVPVPELIPPTLSSPPTDVPSPADPEPEPFANVPGPDLPSSSQPTPSEPGLLPPPAPQPAEPGLPSPPLPQPAEPSPSNPLPEAQLPPSTGPEQEPGTPQPTPDAERTRYQPSNH